MPTKSRILSISKQISIKTLFFAMSVATSAVFAQGSSLSAVPESDSDTAGWSLRNGCVSTQRIRNVDVLDSKTAILELTGGKKLLMRFKNDCRNLKHDGFIYSSRTGQLCAKFDSIRVLRQGNTCMIESFEPYIEPNEDQNVSEE
ncbi:MAG: DUF6491 family protein [Porticoccaceae bacterium]|nr:hypothetical protein [Pseudomonadales bacterium]MCP5171451.1 hypothetical protein [Pseudomonadales bacterium]